MDMIQLCEEFAKVVWPFKEKLKIEDIVLFGSTALDIAGKLDRKPNDADILIVHDGNEVFQKYQEELQRRKDVSDSDKCVKICEDLILAGYPLPPLRDCQIVKHGIEADKLSLAFLDGKFFTDLEYSVLMRSINSSPNFYENVFREGILYNSETRKFDISSNLKYRVSAIPILDLAEKFQSITQ